MVGYQVLAIEDLWEHGSTRRIQPRKTNDLPEEITGSGAVWYDPGNSPSGHKIPPSYHTEIGNKATVIEFLNNQWYPIDWDDGKYLGYWVFPDQKFKVGEHRLGWLRNVLESKTPTTTYRERVESGSTHSEKASERNIEEEADPMDNNPEQTERLAQSFGVNPIFEDIAKEIEGTQDREHYLPTIVPKMKPTSINPPIRVHATREETIGATTDASKLITNAIKIDGNLKGKVPEIFDGDRTKTLKFLNAFGLFHMNNEDNSHMKNPYKCCTYFLGLLNGEKVDDWVEEQTDILREKTTRNSDRIGKDKETLWEDLMESFSNAFAHTGRVEQARTELDRLEMEGNLIDEYIAKFENLLKRGNIPRTDVGAMTKFRDGLRKGLMAQIYFQQQWPEDLDEWEEAARREVRRLSIMREALSPKGNSHLSTKQAKWRANIPNKSQKKRDEAVPMEIDAARTRTPEQIAENARLQKEGLCFKCKKPGHIKKNCPDWPKKKDQPPPYQSKGRTAKAPEDTEQPNDLKGLARSMTSLGQDKQNELFDLLLDGNEDF